MRITDLIRNLTSKDLFKILLWGSAGFYIPVSIVSGILALLDVVPANLNGQQYNGFKGLVIPILSAPIFVLLLALAQWIILAIGLKVVKWSLKIFIKSESH
jgi:hypothetical protein